MGGRRSRLSFLENEVSWKRRHAAVRRRGLREGLQVQEKKKDILIRKIIIRVIIVAVAFSSKPDVLVGSKFVYLYLNFGFSLTVPAHCRPHRM